MLRRHQFCIGLVIVLAGCGGGGTGSTGDPPSDVSASPAAPDQPAPAENPTPETPTPAPPPQALAAAEIERALRRGAPPRELPFPAVDPNLPSGQRSDLERLNSMRQVFSPEGATLRFQMEGLNIVSGGEPIPTTSGMQLPRRQETIVEMAGASVNVSSSNGVVFPANFVAIPATNLVGEDIGEWINGDWAVRLSTQAGSSPDQFRLCWKTVVPELGISDVVEGGSPLPPGPPISRLQCSEHQRTTGMDVGAHIVDDVDGTVTTYRASWEPQPAENEAPVPLPGSILQQALFRGVPIDEPVPASGGASPNLAQRWFFDHSRVVAAPDGRRLHYFAGDNTLLSGVPYEERVTVLPVRLRLARVALQTTATDINVLAVNDIQMPAFPKPIPESVELGKPVGEWVNGEYFVRLVPRAVSGKLELFRVCWEYRMPDLPTIVPVITDAGSVEPFEIAPGSPLSRIQCSQHRRSDAVDVGATVEEGDTIYRGDWKDDPAVLARP